MQYQNIETIITKLDPDLSAAEAHGMATGMVSVNNMANSDAWLREVLQNADGIDADDQAVLESFFTDTSGLFVNEDFAFTIFLPDDEVPLHERLEALRHWCQGYLFGIGFGRTDLQWPGEVLEIIKDIAELTKLDANAEGEEAENDFMEITEYVKAGVIFVNAELNVIDNRIVH